MLTIFTTPKPFQGHAGIIQRNAITSWTLLRPRPEILLLGDEQGAAELSRELGLRHVAEVARNEFGTPRLDDLFAKAQNLSTYDAICYVNADIILLNDFMEAVQRIARWRDRFLMIGCRWDVDINEPWDFSQPETRLRALIRERGKRRGASTVDYFVFSRGLYREMPPLVIGRGRWDHWLVWKAESMGAPVVNATLSVRAVHQNHEYIHPQGERGIFFGEEAKHNWNVAGRGNSRTIEDATHLLVGKKVIRNPWHWAIVVKRTSRRIRGTEQFADRP